MNLAIYHPSHALLMARAVLEWLRMTSEALKDCNKKSLAQMAKEQGISGWHAMRKDQLIRALTVTRTPAPSRTKKAVRAPKTRPAPRAKIAAGQDAVRQPHGARGCRFVATWRPAVRAAAAPYAGSRLPKRPHHRSGPRFVLAACLLGAESHHAGAGPGRAGPGMAQRPADLTGDGRHQ